MLRNISSDDMLLNSGKHRDGREVAIKRFHGETYMVLFQLISSNPPSVMKGIVTECVTPLAFFAMNKILNKALEELVDPNLGFHSDKNIMETITAVAELAFQYVQCPNEFRPSMKQVLETLEGENSFCRTATTTFARRR
ncbi:putative serine/threonine-protein kinase [Sesbania bispinosa]|nr:putative serine/threonine-protein kinase [Sesbania bispinosa]